MRRLASRSLDFVLHTVSDWHRETRTFQTTLSRPSCFEKRTLTPRLNGNDAKHYCPHEPPVRLMGGGAVLHLLLGARHFQLARRAHSEVH